MNIIYALIVLVCLFFVYSQPKAGTALKAGIELKAGGTEPKAGGIEPKVDIEPKVNTEPKDQKTTVKQIYVFVILQLEKKF